MNTEATDNAPQEAPAPLFCDANGARHSADHATEAGNPLGCGEPLPEGAFAASWIENHANKDQDDFYVRVHGIVVPGGYICPQCKTKYPGETPASL